MVGLKNRFWTMLESGGEILAIAIASSAGAIDKDKIVCTGTDGKLSPTLLPAGLDLAAENMAAGETLSAGDFINIYLDGQTRKMRKADASNSRPAHGFVLAGVDVDAVGAAYMAGLNTQLTGLTPGSRYFLANAPGGLMPTVVIASGNLIQSLGTAISSTSLRFEFDEPVFVE